MAAASRIIGPVKYTPPDGSGGGDTTTIVDYLRYDAFGNLTSTFGEHIPHSGDIPGDTYQ